jgi:hypoxanthine-DNA glycosylase
MIRDATSALVTVKHSFAPVVDEGTRVLVCGSLPGEASLAAERYYAHPQNQFWRLISGVIGIDLPMLRYEDRLRALLACGIGLWDVIASATRSGSTDAAIRGAAHNDLTALAATLPQLRAIGFNGNAALRIGRAQLEPAKGCAIIALPSSSPLHTVGLAAKEPAWLQLRDHLDLARGGA